MHEGAEHLHVRPQQDHTFTTERAFFFSRAFGVVAFYAKGIKSGDQGPKGLFLATKLNLCYWFVVRSGLILMHHQQQCSNEVQALAIAHRRASPATDAHVPCPTVASRTLGARSVVPPCRQHCGTLGFQSSFRHSEVSQVCASCGWGRYGRGRGQWCLRWSSRQVPVKEANLRANQMVVQSCRYSA